MNHRAIACEIVDCAYSRVSHVHQTFAGQDEWMEELLGDEYYVDLFAEIADSEPITEAIDEVR